MNNLLKLAHVHCPYCGESLAVDIDCSVEFQDYIEDCQVCCRPISFSVTVDDEDEPSVSVRSENEG